MVTLKHIAREAGVSAGAVSKVLNGRAAEARISQRRAAQIAAIARRLNYHPNAAARSMRSRRTGHVGVLVPNSPDQPATSPQSYYTIVGINIGLESAGYVLSLVRITDLPEAGARPAAGANGVGGGVVGADGQASSRVFSERMLDGMIVITHVPASFAERVERLVPRVVWADANVWRQLNCIRRDEYHAGRTAAEAALAAGYRRVAWFGTDAINAHSHYSHGDRLAGVQQAASDRGVELAVIGTDWSWSADLGRTLEPLLRPDTAMIASDVLRARLVARAALELRRAPGADFGLACCEDTPEITSNWPDLSRVEFDRIALGRRAAEMAATLLSEPEAQCSSYRVTGRWIPGGTIALTGRARDTSATATAALVRLAATASVGIDTS